MVTPPKSQTTAKTIGYFPQTDSKLSLLKTKPMQLTVHGKVVLVPTQSLCPCISTCLVQESTLPIIKVQMKLKARSFDLQYCSACKLCYGSGSTKYVPVTHQYLMGFLAPLYKMKSVPSNTWDTNI